VEEGMSRLVKRPYELGENEAAGVTGEQPIEIA